MERGRLLSIASVVFWMLWSPLHGGTSGVSPEQHLGRLVDGGVRAVMTRCRVPGMAVGVVIGGESHVFNYGVASLETRRPVTDDTLFEIGSVTKVFTVTLAAIAEVEGRLHFTDRVDRHLPELKNTAFGQVTLLTLATHTPGGLPLQVPDEIHNDAQLFDYFKAWQPTYAPGTCRTYANPGIGLLGVIAAGSLGRDFVPLLEQRLFSALGLTGSFIHVPAARVSDYAQGYTREGRPVRMSAGVLASETYGMKSTAADLIRWVEANMTLNPPGGTLPRAIAATHTGYFQAGPMIQDLIWEQYPYPVRLPTLLEGNSQTMVRQPTPVAEIKPPLAPREDVWINKTGSTNGFGAYVAFVPLKRIGIVVLANKNYPIEDRVTLAYRIIESLVASGDPGR